MGTKDFFSSFDVIELSLDECTEILGGDGFMHDLGYSLGRICRAVVDFLEEYSLGSSYGYSGT